MAPPIEVILTIFSEKILLTDFYDVLERRKMELKCIYYLYKQQIEL